MNWKMNNIYFTGVGSRETPESVRLEINKICEFLINNNYWLRSGHADGADEFFETSYDLLNGNKEIWIPWPNFNNSSSTNFPIPDAFELAKTIHPVWNKLNTGARKLHARNMHQVLGKDLKTPSKFTICWTENGVTRGGTASAINLSLKNNIPVLNLGKYSDNIYDHFLNFFDIIN